MPDNGRAPEAAVESVPQHIAGSWTSEGRPLPLVDPFTGLTISEVATASDAQVDAAVATLSSATTRPPLPLHERARVLRRTSELVAERRERIVATIVGESGFTVQDATTEVDRAVETLLLCAEEARRLVGEMVPLDGAPGIAGRLGFTVRHPVGVVCAITPFNSPLNTVSHKVGPAVAAGCPVLLKPSPRTPRTAVLLVEALLDAGLPADHVALVHGDGPDVGQRLLDHPDVALYAFTGSTAVGEHIARSVGLRRRQLELGSIASTIVCADAHLDAAVPLVVNAGYRKAGQVCTSVQRLYVQQDVLDETVDRLLAAVAALRVGDPTDPATQVGTLITEEAATRVAAWAQAAVDGGAERLAGGGRDRALLEPVVLRGVDATMDVMRREVFGPLLSIIPFRDLDEAVSGANDTPYGLAVGLFTDDLPRALAAATRLRFGSVHINQTSSARVDLMPYGGVKASGTGQEGPRYAVREMTEERLVTITT